MSTSAMTSQAGFIVLTGCFVIGGSAASALGQCTSLLTAHLVPEVPQASGDLGRSVAIDGDTLAVTSDEFGGTLHVYHRSGSAWTLEQSMTGSDRIAGERFGYSVAISGDTVVVGAYGHAHNNLTEAGAAYVFRRSGAVWMEEAELLAPDASASDRFGYRVGIFGDTAVIAARWDQNIGSSIGSAYVFVRAEGNWSLQQKLLPPVTTLYFGDAVAVGEDMFVVGSHLSSTAFVFVRNAGSWSFQAQLLPSIGGNGFFGYSLGISGSTVIGGAFAHKKAYVFTHNAGSWTQQGVLATAVPMGDGDFGRSVAISGDLAVVGATNSDIGCPDNGCNFGSACVFERVGSEWVERLTLLDPEPLGGNMFGSSVACDGTTFVVGEPSRDSPVDGPDIGNLFVFELNCDIGTDSDGDGVPDESDACPNNTPGLPVDCSGRPLRDANNDCLVNADDIPIIVDELLLLTTPLVGCNGQPLRDANEDSAVDGADLLEIVAEMLVS